MEHTEAPPIAVRTACCLLAVALAVVLSGGFALSQAQAQSYQTPAKSAVLLDYETNTPLFEKSPHKPLPPASLSKLATIYYTLRAIKRGQVGLEDEFTVSEKAWRMGGSKMFVEVGKKVSVENLLRGVIVSSGNDSSVVLAENFVGSEESFARVLTEMGRELGLKNSTFRNATGWPHPQHMMTASDIASLSRHIIHDFPEQYPMFAERSFTWSDITQNNRNPLLGGELGVDGLKTGHTEAAGYGLATSAKNQDGTRLIAVLLGLTSTAQRRQEAERILRWGFRNFTTRTLLQAGDTIHQAGVWHGDASLVPLVVRQEVRFAASHDDFQGMKAKLRYTDPIVAPIREGQEVGVLTLTLGKRQEDIPVYAGSAVEELGGIARIASSLRYLLFGAETPAVASEGS